MPEPAGHVHEAVEAIALRTQQRGDWAVPVYTFRCACGEVWDEDYTPGSFRIEHD